MTLAHAIIAAMIALQVGSSFAYFYIGNWRQGVFWLAIVVMNYVVTW